jgi:phospholipid/cholesterol/gamma-HCH transport system permease protein
MEPTATRSDSLVGVVGRKSIEQAAEALRIWILPYAACKSWWLESGKGRRIVVRATLYQVYFTAVQPLLLFAFLALLSGIVVVGASDTLLRGAGLAQHVETVAAKAYVRELSPLLLSLVLIGRSGPAIATELGYMKVNHELEGLEALGVNLDYYLVLPRIVGVSVAAVLLSVVMAFVGLAGGWFAGLLLGVVSFGLDIGRLAGAIDLPTGLLALAKSLTFGLTVGTVACHYGLAVGHSHTEIPRANVRAAVLCYALCFTLNAAGSLLALGLRL